MNSLPSFSFGCVNTAFLWIIACRLNGMAIDDRLRPDYSQNFSRSFEVLYFKLHVDCFVAGIEVCSVGIERQYDTASVFA